MFDHCNHEAILSFNSPNVRLRSDLKIKCKVLLYINIARIANLPYGQSQLYLKSAFIKRKALIKKILKFG